jgi:hypothetical protein
MKKFIATVLFAMVCLASNAKIVDITVHTSCGVSYKITEIGDTVTAKDLADYARKLDEIFCG